MAFALVHSRALRGLESPAVTVEVHLANGLPSFTLVGLADTEVKESRERVRAALQTSGLEFPHNRRVTVSLAPADLPKESGRFDLPIALGILAAAGQLDAARLERLRVRRRALAGRRAASRPRRARDGARAAAHAGRRSRARWSCRRRAPTNRRSSAASRCAARAISLDVVRALLPGDAADASGLHEARPMAPRRRRSLPDLRDVRGQAAAKRALEIAAAGELSLLMVGPPGTGKSMLAQRLVGLLPPLIARRGARVGGDPERRRHLRDVERWRERVLRAPHHTASAAALVGGGSPPRPGEASLAHHGVLFLDELPEFPRAAARGLARAARDRPHRRLARRAPGRVPGLASSSSRR